MFKRFTFEMSSFQVFYLKCFLQKHSYLWLSDQRENNIDYGYVNSISILNILTIYLNVAFQIYNFFNFSLIWAIIRVYFQH